MKTIKNTPSLVNSNGIRMLSKLLKTVIKFAGDEFKAYLYRQLMKVAVVIAILIGLTVWAC